MESLRRKPEEMEKLHYDVLEGRSDYIPLVVRIRPRECGIFGGVRSISPCDGMKNPSEYLDVFLENNKENMKLPTDRVITIESNFVVRTDAESVEEAARLYDRWREYFEKRHIS